MNFFLFENVMVLFKTLKLIKRNFLSITNFLMKKKTYISEKVFRLYIKNQTTFTHISPKFDYLLKILVSMSSMREKNNSPLTNAVNNFSNGGVTVTLLRQHPVRYMADSHGEEPHREVWQGRQETVLNKTHYNTI